ncbi:MAG: SMP-30/gluconolactonase/LRE family protein [Acidimicrobiales bacterium]|jgi:sugar lactone lactonase YvrE
MARFTNVGVEVIADVHADVGEGPHWDHRSQTLLFVDVSAGTVFRYDPLTVSLRSFSVGQEVGAVVPRRAGGLVLAVRDGVAQVSDTGEGFELMVAIEETLPTNRMNDAKCDPKGRLFAGTMAFDFSPHAAALYRVEPDWAYEQIVEGVTISNGLGWSTDARQMYFIDTATHGVDVFDYDLGTGSIRNRRRVVTIDKAQGDPDGMTIDSEGNLWVACWGGGAVRCFSPEGEQLGEVTFPVSQVSSCTFGGSGFSDLFVTSAASGLSAAQLHSEPFAGATFACSPGVTGVPSSPFAG